MPSRAGRTPTARSRSSSSSTAATLSGKGAHPDVIVASARAYINALNRLEWLKKDKKKVKVE